MVGTDAKGRGLKSEEEIEVECREKRIEQSWRGRLCREGQARDG